MKVVLVDNLSGSEDDELQQEVRRTKAASKAASTMYIYTSVINKQYVFQVYVLFHIYNTILKSSLP